MAQVPGKVALSRSHTPVADGFTVAWTDLTNETAYHLEHSTGANFTSSTLITNISANSTSHNLTGLTPATTYYVRVRAAAAGGNGTWSDVQAVHLQSLEAGQTKFLSAVGVPPGASHSVNFTVSDIFGSANTAGLAAGATASAASTIMLLGSNGSTEHTIFYNTAENQWREGPTNKGSQVVGLGKGFMLKNNTATTDYFLLVGRGALLEPGTVSVFDAGAPAGRLSLVTPTKTTATSLRHLGLANSNNTTTGLKRATAAKDADMLLIPDSAGGLRRYHFDGTSWRSGLRTVSDPSAVTVPAGGAFFLRRAAGSNFVQWKPPTEMVSDGLVLHLDAANTDSYPGSGTAWTDLSGSGSSGTLTNGPTLSSSNGGSIVFDGTNDYVTGFSDVALSTNSSFTVELWFNLQAYSDNFPSLLQLKTNTAQGWNLTLSQQSSYLGVVFGSFSTWGRYKTDAAPSTGTWHHLVVTYNGAGAATRSNYSVYLNNVLQTLSDAGGFNSTTQVNYIGTTNAASRGVDDFNGNISTIRIYNRTLSPSEILHNYNVTKERYGIVRDGLVLHLDAANTDSYPGSGTTWADLSGNGNSGNLTNGPSFNSSNGGSIVFDGVDDSSISLSSSTLNITQNITVSAWVKFNASLVSQLDHLAIISKENWAGNSGYRLSFRTDQGSNPLSWRVNSSITNNYCEWVPGTYFDDLNWHYIVATYDKSSLKLFVDNTQRASYNYTSDITLTTNNLGIGGRLNGNVSQVLIYNRALSTAEMLQNFNATKGRYGL